MIEDNDIKKLTPREKQILFYIAKGFANKSIANLLGINTVSVKPHITSIFKKLGISNRNQAAIFFYKGFISKIAKGEIDNPKQAAIDFLKGDL